MNKKYLIQVSIGPVQDFIASARKLRDLWFGSDLLSELSKTVARSFNKSGAKLIFPAIDSVDELELHSELIVANKILAEIECDNPSEIISNAKEMWQEQLNSFADIALEEIDKIKKIKINRELYKKQVGDFGEFFGAWVELTDDYVSCKSSLEQLLAGRKNLRQFSAPRWDGFGIPKNSLDGYREAVTGDNQREIIGLLKKNERLDTLGCIKRFYPISSHEVKTKKFEDLADIALVPWLKNITSKGNSFQLLKEFEDKILDLGYKRGSGKFRPNNDLRVESEAFYLNKGEPNNDVYNIYKQLISRKNAGEPNKYAIILVGDGDKMGEMIDKITSADAHRIFSKELGKFAQNIGKTIAEYDGSLIYAGGDDVMAYLTLDSAIICADAIQKEFGKTMQIIFDKLELSGDKPTFSIGMTIVHHSEPLNSALILARKAESIAKNEGGRNALALIQHKRGGSDLQIVGKWNRDDGKANVVKRINAMIELYLNGDLPSTLGYQLRQTAVDAGDTLCYEYNNDKLLPKNATSTLVLRLFNQKENTNLLIPLLLEQTSVRTLSDELVVARQIAGAVKMSKGGR